MRPLLGIFSGDRAMQNEHSGVNSFLRMLAEQSREHGFMLLDPSGRITWWSQGSVYIFGFTEEEVVGKHFTLIFTKEDVATGVADHELVTAKTEGSAENDRWLVRKDGSRFWANGATVALHNEQEQHVGYGKVLRDRLDVKEQLETFRSQFAAAEALNKRKDVFLSTLSHELRNPLAPLTNAVRLVRMSVPKSVDIEYPLRIIERQISNLARLVDDLLDVSRIGAGKIELKKQAVPVQDVVRTAVESIRAALRERRQTLDVLMPPQPLVVEVDPDRMDQVFVNLLNNAVKFTPEQGHIWIKGTSEGNEVVVHVEDNGVGIAQDMLPRIFELFTQVESSRYESRGGLGIGLSLVKDLVTLHGGSVQVRSDGPGKGSEFTVRLPLKTVDHDGKASA